MKLYSTCYHLPLLNQLTQHTETTQLSSVARAIHWKLPVCKTLWEFFLLIEFSDELCRSIMINSIFSASKSLFAPMTGCSAAYIIRPITTTENTRTIHMPQPMREIPMDTVSMLLFVLSAFTVSTAPPFPHRRRPSPRSSVFPLHNRLWSAGPVSHYSPIL